MHIYIYIYTYLCMYYSTNDNSDNKVLMGTLLKGYPVLRENIPLRTSHVKSNILRPLARERLGTRWARYPFCRRRSFEGISTDTRPARMMYSLSPVSP